MFCTQCGTKARMSARYCQECGAPLAAPDTNHEVPEGQVGDVYCADGPLVTPTVHDRWQSKSDEELVAAADKIYEYSEEGDRAIRKEMGKRGLDLPLAVASCPHCGRSLAFNHTGSACLQCDHPFDPAVLETLRATVTTAPVRATQVEPVAGIGGWLVLPAIALVISPITASIELFTSWRLIATFAPELSGDLRFMLSGLVGVVMIVATVFVAILFFRWRRAAILGMVGLLAGQVVGALLQVLLISSMFDGGGDGVLDVLRQCVYAGIWIPYFLRSKRVKNTFTES